MPAERLGGNNSHAEGFQTQTYSDYSHTEGCLTKTFGRSSHAEGSGSITYGNFSHAEGIGTITYGLGSHASGLYTIASGSNQTVVGQYNKRGNTTDLFVIGGGSGDADVNRKDVFNVSTTTVIMSGSVNISGSLFATSSWATNALTASYLSTLQSELNSITIFNLFIS